MLRTGTATALAASLVVLMASACGGDGGSGAAGDEPALKEVSAKDFDPENFDRSTTIDNPWFPLEPGTQLVFEGSTREEGRRVPHRVAYTVTDLAKEIGGVRNVVIWERDWRAGELQEAELALFAQDNDGNVWHLGQYPEEYEAGKVVATPAWFHGLKRARAGIAMKAHPRLGAPPLLPGVRPAPGQLGRPRRGARGRDEDLRSCQVLSGRPRRPRVRAGQAGSSQLKYYARGVGNVRVGWLGRRDQDREVLALVKVVHLDQQALAEVRREALRLEARAYKISEDVYGRTLPSEPID